MKRLLILGLVAFLLLSMVTFPARIAYQLFAPPAVQLNGINGSVWNGSATEAMAGGAYVRDITWRLRPASLFSGKLAFDTRSSPMSGRIDAVLTVTPDGALSLTELNGRVPLDLAHPLLLQNGIRGDVELDLSSLDIVNGLPVAAEGTITVRDFHAAELSAERIGDFVADIHTDAGAIGATVTDLNGVLDLNATVTITAARSFAFLGEVAPRTGAPGSITNQLRFLGAPNERGRYEFRVEGQF